MGCTNSRDADAVLDGEVNFDHFRIIRAIGRGAFGKVCIVEKVDTKKQYAMKYVNKGHCLKMKCGPNTVREEKILASLDVECPFIVSLWFAFQDMEDLFFVVDYMAGGDLSFHLKNGRFDESRARLYVAEVALALQYLHKNNIIHRDIKPDNLLLDAAGHVHLTDFNVAYLKEGANPKKPRSVAGTRPYMAPEVILASNSEGYTPAVDWWSLGVTMYEFLTTKLPFNVPRDVNPRKVVEYFRKVTVLYPKSLSESCIHCVQQLLRVTVTKRVQDVDSLKQLDFFKDLDFDAVWKLEVTPAFIPQADHINCDPMHELEEMIVEPQPLHKKKHRLNKRRASQQNLDLSEVNKDKDLVALEKHFFVFDRERGGVVVPESEKVDEDVTLSSSDKPEAIVEASSPMTEGNLLPGLMSRQGSHATDFQPTRDSLSEACKGAADNGKTTPVIGSSSSEVPEEEGKAKSIAKDAVEDKAASPESNSGAAGEATTTVTSNATNGDATSPVTNLDVAGEEAICTTTDAADREAATATASGAANRGTANATTSNTAAEGAATTTASNAAAKVAASSATSLSAAGDGETQMKDNCGAEEKAYSPPRTEEPVNVAIVDV